MASWILALGIGAGYLINKRISTTGLLVDGAAEEAKSDVPAADPNLTTQDVQDAKGNNPFEIFGDMKHNLPMSEKKELDAARVNMELATSQFDGAPLKIEGVMMQFDRSGV